MLKILQVRLQQYVNQELPDVQDEFRKGRGTRSNCILSAASSFRIWNSSTGIPSPPLALFVVMFPKDHLTYIPGCLALGE